MRARPSPPHRLLAALLASLAACGPGDDPDVTPETEALDSTDSTVTEGALLLITSDGLLASPGPLQAESVAQLAAQRVSVHYRPLGCATATARGATVAYSFQTCRALNGMVHHLTGALTVDFAVAADRVITGHARAEALRISGAVVDVDLDATLSAQAGGLSITAQTRSSGVGARRVTFAREGGYTVRWEPTPQCAQLDGAWNTRTPRAMSRTTVTALRRCMGRCPQFGGSVAYTGGAPAVTVTTTFTGGATAQWQSTDGRAGTLALDCTN